MLDVVARIGGLWLLVGLGACSSDGAPGHSEAGLSEGGPIEDEGGAGGPGASPAGTGGQGGNAALSSSAESGGQGGNAAASPAGSGGQGGRGPWVAGAGGEVGGAAEPAPSTSVATDEHYFLPWESFASVADGEPLRAPLEVRWVSAGSARNGENLVVAIATESGHNRIVTLSAAPDPELRAFRDHGIDFACGDCEMAARSGAVVVSTDSRLHGSSDGGESYFEIAPLDEPVERLFISGERVYARTSTGWAFAPWAEAAASEAAVLTPLPWTHAVAHIGDDAALEVTADEVRLHRGSETLSSERPCAAPDVPDAFSSGRYDTRVIVACAGGSVAISEDFPVAPFSIWNLEEDVVWIGPSFYVATATSWYSTTTQTEGHRVGGQLPLEEDERVWGHAEGARVGFRVTSHGVGWTYTGMISEP